MAHLLPLRLAAGEQTEGRKEDETAKCTPTDHIPPVRVRDQRRDERVGQGEPDGDQTQPDPCDATPHQHGKQQWQRKKMVLLKEMTFFEIQNKNVKKRKEKGDRPH